MKIEGRCHCGKIGYEAEIDPGHVVICHCADCQTIPGAPYRTVVPAKAESFKMRGEAKNRFVASKRISGTCLRPYRSMYADFGKTPAAIG